MDWRFTANHCMGRLRMVSKPTSGNRFSTSIPRISASSARPVGLVLESDICVEEDERV